MQNWVSKRKNKNYLKLEYLNFYQKYFIYIRSSYYQNMFYITNMGIYQIIKFILCYI